MTDQPIDAVGLLESLMLRATKHAPLPWRSEMKRSDVVEIYAANDELILGRESNFVFNLPEYEEYAIAAANAYPTLAAEVIRLRQSGEAMATALEMMHRRYSCGASADTLNMLICQTLSTYRQEQG
jgi:hypothetical protein